MKICYNTFTYGGPPKKERKKQKSYGGMQIVNEAKRIEN